MEFEDNELDIDINSNTNNLNLESKSLEMQMKASNETKVDVKIQENQISMETPQVITSTDHNKMINRNLADQHSIGAITGLREELDNAGKVKDVLVNGESVLNNQGNANIEIPEIQDYKANSNITIENGTIKGFTDTGYKIIDKDVQLQSITEVSKTGENKIIYFDGNMFIYDGSNKIRKSTNLIDFEIIELPRICKSMIYNTYDNRLICLSDNGYLMYSEDLGETWNVQEVPDVIDSDYLFENKTTAAPFIAVNIKTKTIINLSGAFSKTSQINCTIEPTFILLLNSSQFIWCDSYGKFKYFGASKELNFPSIPNGNVNLLKKENNKIFVCQKNSDKLYMSKSTSVANNEWIEYILPEICTVNDVIFNPYDSTYYIITDINNYYKTKDFIACESVKTNNLRGLKGYFTLKGIQLTSSDNNKLFLAPRRTRIENKLQEHDRILNKEIWVGNGLELEGEQIHVKESKTIRVDTKGVHVQDGSLGYSVLEPELAKQIQIALSPIIVISPDELEDWFWENWIGEDFEAWNIMFTESGSFLEFMEYEKEYEVEKGELGYISIDGEGLECPYVSKAKFGPLFN